MGNRDLYYDHMSTEGSLAFNYDECHAYSMRGGIDDRRAHVEEEDFSGYHAPSE